MKQQTVLRRSLSEEVNFDLVEREIRKRRFGVLSTVSQDGRSHSVGVLYGISTRDQPFVLYVTTDRRSKKARNITRNENVSFAIPLQRRILRFLPPNCVQFQAIAELIASDDEDANSAFSRSLVLRETLKLETFSEHGGFYQDYARSRCIHIWVGLVYHRSDQEYWWRSSTGANSTFAFTAQIYLEFPMKVSPILKEIQFSTFA